MRGRGERREPRPWVTALTALLLAPWLVWLVVRAAGLDVGYPLVAAISFTPYVALTSVIPLLVALALRRVAVALVALCVTGAFVVLLVPRVTGGGDAEAAGGTTLTVMTANMLRGGADPATIVALVGRYDVDVLALQELTPEGARRLDAAGLRQLLPRRAFEARPGAAGTGIAADRRLEDVGDLTVRGVAAQPEATIRVGSRDLRITAVHPVPPVNREREAIWRRGLAALPRGDAASATRPAILVGDFNATLDHRPFRDVLATGWTDAADATGDGWKPTWRQPRFLPLTIDHVLTSAGVRAVATSVHPLPRSDHRAVVVRLRVG